MMLAAIPHVTVATDGVLCTRTADGGGRVLTNALRVWNMSGSLLGEHVCRSMPAPGAAAGGHGAKLGTAAGGGVEGPTSVEVHGAALLMLRKFGYQWAHMVFDNAARLAFAHHVLAQDDLADLHLIVDELTRASEHTMEVLRAFLGPGARRRLAVLRHCAVHQDAFEHAVGGGGSSSGGGGRSSGAAGCASYVHADSLLIAEPIGPLYHADRGLQGCPAHVSPSPEGQCSHGAGAGGRWWQGAAAGAGDAGGATAQHGCWPSHAMALLAHTVFRRITFRRFGQRVPPLWAPGAVTSWARGRSGLAGKAARRQVARSLFARAVRDCAEMKGQPWLYSKSDLDSMDITGT